jgi:hypothetical protein
MRYAMMAFAAMLLCSCNILDTKVQSGYALGPGWTTPTAFTTADVRTITQRQHPLLGNQVLCTEPVPDVATALATSATLSAQGGNGAATGGLNLSGASSEAIAELAGRSTALLGLRDGLFRACEAYANGIIGQDAYALVLSRYSQLMTTLFLGQDITGAASSAGKVSATSPGPAGQTGAGTSPGSTTGAGKTTQGAGDAAPNPGQAQAQPTGSGAAPASAAGASTVAALALTRMNEDYFNLDMNLAHLLVVACINNGDPTRYRTNVSAVSQGTGASPPWIIPGPEQRTDVTQPSGSAATGNNRQTGAATPGSGTAQGNAWLMTVCPELSLAEIKGLEAASLQVISATPALHPVNPEVAAAQPTGGSGNKTNTPNAPAQKADATVKAVQEALKKLDCTGCKALVADGVDGPQTDLAVLFYQLSKQAPPNPLPLNGNPTDAATVKSLTPPQPTRPTGAGAGGQPAGKGDT